MGSLPSMDVRMCLQGYGSRETLLAVRADVRPFTYERKIFARSGRYGIKICFE